MGTMPAAKWVPLALVILASPVYGIEFRPITNCCPSGQTVRGLSQPTFSPDARTLAYCVESQYSPVVKPSSVIAFLALRPPGGAPISLPPAAWGGMTAPAWSSDGKRLAFACKSPDVEHAGLWVAAQPARGVITNLTRWVAASDVEDLAWLPGGAGLAYSDGEVLWRVSGPLVPPVRLTRGPGSQPSCAIGGTAYVRESHIWIFDGERERQLTFGASHESTPAISSDAEWIVFVSDRGGQSDLWLISSGGGTMVPLTNDAAEDLDPTWSRAGDLIAFVSWRNGNPNVWLASDLPYFTVGVQERSWADAKAMFDGR